MTHTNKKEILKNNSTSVSLLNLWTLKCPPLKNTKHISYSSGDAESGWRLPPDKKARRNASYTWDVKHNGHSDPADLIGGNTPDSAFWNAQIHATCANTNHLWERAGSAFAFLNTGGYNLIYHQQWSITGRDTYMLLITRRLHNYLSTAMPCHSLNSSGIARIQDTNAR